jgi:transposase InsO family protein
MAKQTLVEQAIDSEVKQLVDKERKLLPRLGTRKLYYLIRPQLQQRSLKLGRDKLFNLLGKYDLLIKPMKKYTQTTNSKHWLRKYPNIVKDKEITEPEQVWVSDITYIKTEQGNMYLSLITDAFSRKIVGYNIDDNMEAISVGKALKMAKKNRNYTENQLIHHSDRGLQYCSSEYVAIAADGQIQMSMTENSDPYENALAERMNRTLKEEFGLGKVLSTKQQAIELLIEAVDLYNNRRPHLSLQMKTPQQVHKQKSRPLEAAGTS